MRNDKGKVRKAKGKMQGAKRNARHKTKAKYTKTKKIIHTKYESQKGQRL